MCKGWNSDVEVGIVCRKGCERFISIADEADQGGANGSVRFCVYDTTVHRSFVRNGNAGKHIHNLG